jgi:hypothetical protein
MHAEISVVNMFFSTRTLPSPIQTVLSALESHQIHRFQAIFIQETGSRAKRLMSHHRRLGISPDPEGAIINEMVQKYIIIVNITLSDLFPQFIYQKNSRNVYKTFFMIVDHFYINACKKKKPG